MGRKRIDLGADAAAEIEARLARGEKAPAIARGLGVSAATVKRRIREMKGLAPAKSPGFAPPREPMPTAPDVLESITSDEIPEGTSLAGINELLEIAQTQVRHFAEQNDVDNHVKYLRIAAFLLEAKRKATPLPKADPNDSPDMIAAADEAFEKLHKLVDSLARVSNSPLAETIGRLLHEPTS